jgi:hypothetical protein
VFIDRSRRLVLFGIVLAAVGGGVILLALLYAALAFFDLAGSSSLVDARSAATGAMLYALLGAAFVAVGWGSMLKRRWARPLALTLAWSWLLGGVLLLGLLPSALAVALETVPAAPAPIVGLVWGLASLGAVLLPALSIWVYSDRDLRATCEAADPRRVWTDRCPPSVLGLSLGFAACGLMALLSLVRPAVPLFGRVVTGRPGAACLTLSAVLCFWLARATFRLRPAGWWAASAATILVGLSSGITLRSVGLAELYAALGYPDAARAGLPLRDDLALALTVVVTVISLIYMVGIRRHFRGLHP